MLYTGLIKHTDLRERLTVSKSFEELNQICADMKQRRKNVNASDKLGWYFRYFKDTSKNPMQI